MEKQKLQSYRSTLESIRGRLRDEVNRMIEAAAEDASGRGELSHVPTHNADHDTEGLDSEIALIQNEQGIRLQVVEALQRIEEGTYGRCEECGRDIPRARLNAIPWTAHCRDCAERLEE